MILSVARSHQSLVLSSSVEGMNDIITKRILVVDDDPSIRSLVAEVLEDEGFTVDLASNGAEALALLEGSLPSVIVTDLMMPVMDGWEFVRTCRQDTGLSGVPIVVMSAAHGLPDHAKHLGVRACLAKPFDLDVLVGAVDRLTRPQSSPDSYKDWAA